MTLLDEHPVGLPWQKARRLRGHVGPVELWVKGRPTPEGVYVTNVWMTWGDDGMPQQSSIRAEAVELLPEFTSRVRPVEYLDDGTVYVKDIWI